MNSKISLSLFAFESLNQSIQESDPLLFDFYEELRASVIAVLNEIVANYVPKTVSSAAESPTKVPQEKAVENKKASTSKTPPPAKSPKHDASPIKPAKADTTTHSSHQNKNQYARSQSPGKEQAKEAAVLPKIEKALAEPEASKDKKQATITSQPNKLLNAANFKDFNQVMAGVNFKSLSLRQTKEFIEELYEAKTAYDNKCIEQALTKQTMEQFMYHHLKQRYGLNTAVIEWVLAVVEAVRIYSKKDNDLATFGYVC